ncbi:MAG: VCBS repeat-containing protein, partial [Acidobacteriota bacterium]
MERPSRKSCTYPNRYRLVIGLITALGFVVGSTDSIEARPRPSQPARPALDQAAEQSTTVPSFTEIATNPASGLAYARGASPINAVIDDLRQRSLIAPLVDGVDFELPELPLKTHGQPGVAILDYDDDGDLDLYVTNGAGVGNSLFSNLLSETGEVTFVDVAAQAGVAATAQDSMGVCYGDIDNDDDHDLLVLGRSEPNRFFVNQGNGTFTEAADSGLEGGDLGHSSCSMGDVNGDGLLDVFVANVWDLDNLRACFTVPFAESHHNQLFINQGDGTFTDTSATSGIEDLAGLPPEAAGSATLTWAVGLLDIDLDGDIDIILGDDQCALGEERFGGVDRGFLHVLLNDGTGHFVDEAFLLHDQASSSWMGLAFGDLNCDGNLDVFGSNFGDYDDAIAAPFPYELGDQTTRWLLGNGDGSWTDPTIGQIASVFGWGNGIFDYDNDGDQDVVYHGGLDLNFFHAEDNPGVLLENQGCSAEFVTRVDAFPTDHQRRTVQGVALGDLDRNGFVDVVSVSNVDMPQALPLLP